MSTYSNQETKDKAKVGSDNFLFNLIATMFFNDGKGPIPFFLTGTVKVIVSTIGIFIIQST